MMYSIKHTLKSVGLVLVASLPLGVNAAEIQSLKICAAEDEMPYSNSKGEGFENSLAKLMAKSLNRPLEWVRWKDPRYFVRDYLDKGLCDVVMGVDTGDPRMLTSEPYYRSGYVFVTKEKDGLEAESWDSEAVRKAQRIAFIPGTPAETMLRAIGRYNDMFNYSQALVGYKSKRNQYVKYEMSKLVGEVASGNAEVAALWGPAAARYVKESSTPLKMTLIPDGNKRADGEKVPHHFSTSIGVAKGQEALLKEINHFLKQQQGEVEQILEAEGIPLVPLDEAQVASNN